MPTFSLQIEASSVLARLRASSALLVPAWPTIFQTRRPLCWLWMK